MEKEYEFTQSVKAKAKRLRFYDTIKNLFLIGS